MVQQNSQSILLLTKSKLTPTSPFSEPTINLPINGIVFEYFFEVKGKGDFSFISLNNIKTQGVMPRMSVFRHG